MPKHTPGEWVQGKSEDSIVSKTQPPLYEADHFYGGALICESVSDQDRPLIMAAPKLLLELTAIVKAMRAEILAPSNHISQESRIRLLSSWDPTVALIIEAGGSIDE